MRPLHFALLLAFMPFGSNVIAAASDAPRGKNVLFILADDLGWADTTLYGQTKLYRTPNLDRLARMGMTFARAYSASPLCSPSRSAILTGLSPARTGITAPNCHLPEVRLQASSTPRGRPDQKATIPQTVTRLSTDRTTLAETLREAGYATGHFGKWHLGAEPYSALQHGFDVDVPHHPGPGPAGSYVAPWRFRNFEPKMPGEHIEDRMAEEAVAWMEKVHDRPFFMNYWMFSVHAPFDAKKSLIEKYRAVVDPKQAQHSPTYAAMVESMDDAVGTLLDALERLKIADRTIVIFTSDNGGNMYSEVDGTVPTSNAPLRGGKATLYEGGTRVPCVMAWPGITKPGSRSDVPVQGEDYYPTLLEGLAIPAANGQRFDGVSVFPALQGQPVSRQNLFRYFPHQTNVPDWLPPAVSVTQGDSKLIRIFHGGEKGAHRYLLFDLKTDLGERRNLAADDPASVRRLDALIDQFLADTRPALPLPNPDFDPNAPQPAPEGRLAPKAKARAKAKAKAKTKAAARAKAEHGESSTRN